MRYTIAISDATGQIHVFDENGNPCGGPYKDEKSAKRGIRRLKRKERD
jgi:hypothetical protein